jgi:hypothetical protein
MAVTCGCERNTFGTIEKLCADHSFAEQRRCHGLIRRAEELEAALQEVMECFGPGTMPDSTFEKACTALERQRPVQTTPKQLSE